MIEMRWNRLDRKLYKYYLKKTKNDVVKLLD